MASQWLRSLLVNVLILAKQAEGRWFKHNVHIWELRQQWLNRETFESEDSFIPSGLSRGSCKSEVIQKPAVWPTGI